MLGLGLLDVGGQPLGPPEQGWPLPWRRGADLLARGLLLGPHVVGDRNRRPPGAIGIQ